MWKVNDGHGVRDSRFQEKGGGIRIVDPSQALELVGALARRLSPILGSDGRLVGIDERGVALAQLLAAELPSQGGCAPIRLDPGVLALTPGDTGRGGAQRVTAWADEAELPISEPVVLVDTAFLRGRRVMRAVRHLASAGVARIDVAVLCLVREDEHPGPIECLYGMEVRVGPREILRVRVPPVDPDLDVWLMPEE